jgi:hypothetical protein
MTHNREDKTVTEHPHAEFLRYVADGGDPDDWEVRGKTDACWLPTTAVMCGMVLLHPEHHAVRRRPRTVTRTITYPEPLREEPKRGQAVYVADPTEDEGYFFPSQYFPDVFGQWVFKHGLLHATEEAARQHGMALAGIEEDSSDE